MDTKTCCKCGDSLPLTEFYFKDKKKGRRQGRCKPCYKQVHKIYQRTYYIKNKEAYRQRTQAWNTKARHRNHKYLLEFFITHPCIVCGEADPVVLEFDHRDPKVKSHTVSKMLSALMPWDKILLEIEKCNVVCANCHRKRTAKQFGWYKASPD